MFRCTTCGLTGGQEEFERVATRKPCKCLQCCRESTKKYAARNKTYWSSHDPYREHKTGSKKCPGCKETLHVREFSRRGASADGLTSRCKACERAKHREHRYGVVDVPAIRLAQRDLCNICGEGFGDTVPHVDHDHNSGRVRALLCPNCNAGLGFFKDSPRLLENAGLYLSLHTT